jgi:hypothetical protein
MVSLRCASAVHKDVIDGRVLNVALSVSGFNIVVQEAVHALQLDKVLIRNGRGKALRATGSRKHNVHIQG